MTSVADQFQCQHNRLTVNWHNNLATLSCNYTVRNRLLLENHKLSKSSHHLPFYMLNKLELGVPTTSLITLLALLHGNVPPNDRQETHY